MAVRVLLPLNGTVEAEVALLPALFIATVGQAELHLLRVIAPPPCNRRLSKMAAEVVDQTSFAMARQYLRGVTTYAAGRWAVPVRCTIRRGPVPQMVLHLVEEREIDFIIMSSHYHGRLQRWLKRLGGGSISEQVTRASPVPVLLVSVTPLPHPGMPGMPSGWA